MVLIVCPHMVLIVCFPLSEHARGQPGIATAGCRGGATRVEILAVQRSAVRDRQYRHGGVDLRGIFSPAHTKGCLRRLLALSPPLPHGGAQRPEGASAASAGAVSHGSCLASHCPCVVIESKAGGTPEGRKQQVPAYPTARASVAGKRLDERALQRPHASPCVDPVASAPQDL